MMKIPKEVASCLNTPKHGLARLRLGKESFRRTEYDTSLVDRLFFKQGWKKFLTRHDMRLALRY
uniref:Uncharacterized protein n=1 Tax=Triticum urartu TaxID=4572 RepID=A0A8R7R465_TRIUA